MKYSVKGKKKKIFSLRVFKCLISFHTVNEMKGESKRGNTTYKGNRVA